MRKTSPKGTKLPPRRFWTDADVEKLKELYPNTANAAIAKQLEISTARVEAKAKKLDLRKTEAFFSVANSANAASRFATVLWSEDEDALLKQYYPTDITLTELSKKFKGRTPQSLMKRALILKMKRPVNAWTKEQKALLTEHYQSKGIQFVSKLIPEHPVHSLRMQARKMGLLNMITERNWTVKQHDILVKHYPSKGAAWVAAQVNHPVGSVAKRASKFGIVRVWEPKVKLRAPKKPRAPKVKVAALPVAPKPTPPPVVTKPKGKAAKRPNAVGPKRWYHYPWGSEEYKAGEEALKKDKILVSFMDEYGREAVKYRNKAAA